MATKPPWKRKNPAKKHHKLTPAAKARARARAHRAGRAHPSLVDNMNAAKAAGKPTKKKGVPKTKRATAKK